MDKHVLLIGAGNMGFAMLKGWLRANSSIKFYVVDPVEANCDRASELGANAYLSISELPKDLTADLTVLAVKPQMVTGIVAELTANELGHGTLLSVAAGITLKTISNASSDGTKIIRCMPNTPAAIGQGMMVLVADKNVEMLDREFATLLMKSSGAVAWIDDENLMNAVTAISGSGPAYIFHFIEALSNAATALGLPDQIAGQLALQTVMGAGAMAASSQESPTNLRKNVTSPNGTTEAALNILMKDGALEDLIKSATRAARDRGIELSKT